MPRKLIVLNSFGPMGSTLLAGLIEKFGYANAPFRKSGLHQYLMGEYDLASGYMQKRTREIVLAQSKPSVIGGVSVMDRDGQKPFAHADYTRVEKELDELDNTKFTSVSDLYFSCVKVFHKSLTYKEVKDSEKVIELTVDIHRFNPKALYEAYQKGFDEVYMIHLHRDFGGWMNSLASQHFANPQLSNRIKFFPHMRYADYALYEKSVNEMPGLHVRFDDLFDKPIETLAQEIADFIGEPVPQINFRDAEYDMYGSIAHYDKAFKRHDDNVSFLNKGTIAYYTKLARREFHGLGDKVISWLRYLSDMIFYNMKAKT